MCCAKEKPKRGSRHNKADLVAAFASPWPVPTRRPHCSACPHVCPPTPLYMPSFSVLHSTCSLPTLSPHVVDRQLDASLAAIRASPIVLCVRMTDPDIAMEAACAAVRGGIRCVEITMTTPEAPKLITALSARFPGAHVGAGTVLTVAEADAAAACGAGFALSPAVDVDVIARLHAHGVLAVPGAATPTEVATAGVRCGARLVKLFPAELIGGVRLVRALQGPLGHVPLLPTSGIDLAGADAYFAERNVAAVGASRQVLEPAAVARRDWDAVAENARRWVEVAAKHRGWQREKCDGLGREVFGGR